MPEEFGGDLTGAEFWGADLRGATFRDVHFGGVRISHAWVTDVEMDVYVDRLVVNGVDVTDFVNERDRWYPVRTVLGATDPDKVRAGWPRLREAWAALLARAAELPDGAVDESVAGEWSLQQTLRHLLMAMDKWFTAPILGGDFNPLGMANTGSADLDWPGIDPDARPTFTDVLDAREEQAMRFAAYIGDLTTEEMDRTVEVLENGPHQVRDCLLTVLEEEFWHLRYADRDLGALEARR